MKATHDMTKRNTTSNETPSIVLKTIHNDIMKSNANATCTTKSMRIWLRANMRDAHVHNASWLFTSSQYDVVRAQFDVAYRAKIERANKRNNATTKRAKRDATTNVDVVETIDAND